MTIGRMSWLRLASKAAPSMTSATCACSAGVSGSTMAECTSGSAAGESSTTPISHRRSRLWGGDSRRATGRQPRPRDRERGPTARTVGRLRPAPGSQLDDQLERDRFLTVRAEVVPANRRGDRDAIVHDVLDGGRDPADALRRRIGVVLDARERGEAVTELRDQPPHEVGPHRVADVVLRAEIAADAGIVTAGARGDAVASDQPGNDALAGPVQDGRASVAQAIVLEAEVVQEIAHSQEAQELFVRA